jgi:hypothetical protein
VIDEVLAEDLVHCTRAARVAAEPMVAEIRRDGVPFEWLRRCEEEGQDGTRLGGSEPLRDRPPSLQSESAIRE